MPEVKCTYQLRQRVVRPRITATHIGDHIPRLHAAACIHQRGKADVDRRPAVDRFRRSDPGWRDVPTRCRSTDLERVPVTMVKTSCPATISTPASNCSGVMKPRASRLAIGQGRFFASARADGFTRSLRLTYRRRLPARRWARDLIPSFSPLWTGRDLRRAPRAWLDRRPGRRRHRSRK